MGQRLLAQFGLALTLPERRHHADHRGVHGLVRFGRFVDCHVARDRRNLRGTRRIVHDFNRPGRNHELVLVAQSVGRPVRRSPGGDHERGFHQSRRGRSRRVQILADFVASHSRWRVELHVRRPLRKAAQCDQDAHKNG